jgi:hypothetical protein
VIGRIFPLSRGAHFGDALGVQHVEGSPEQHTRKRSVALLSLHHNLALLSSWLLSCMAVPLAGAQSTNAGKAPLSAETLAVHLQAKRSVANPAANIEPAVTSAGSSSAFNSEQGPGPGPIGPGPGCDLFPAPAL